MLEVSAKSKGDKRIFPEVSVEQRSPVELVGALCFESITSPYSGASVVWVSTSGCPFPQMRQWTTTLYTLAWSLTTVWGSHKTCTSSQVGLG